MTNYEISLVFSTEVPSDTFDQSVAIAQLLCPAMPKELVDSSGNDAGEGPRRGRLQPGSSLGNFGELDRQAY